MSDSGEFMDVGGWGSGGAEGSGLPRKRAAAPMPEHEDFARTLTAFVEDILDAYLPKMATVNGMDGGRIKVQMDEEEEARDVGFPRQAGATYKTGDRVLVVPSRSGDPMVVGPIRTETGAAGQAVGQDDIMDGNVTSTKLAPQAVQTKNIGAGAVDQTQIAENAVTANKIARNSITKDELKPGAVDSIGIANKAVNKDKLSDGVQSSINKADTALQPGDVSSGPSNNAFNSLADKVKAMDTLLNRVKTDVDDLNDDVGTLKADAHTHRE